MAEKLPPTKPMAEKLPPTKKPATFAAHLKQRIQNQFTLLVQKGLNPNDAAVKALAIVKEGGEPAVGGGAEHRGAEVAVGSGAPENIASRASWTCAPQAPDPVACAKYGPLCLGLAGPFQSICVVGEPRLGKNLLVLDIDHTLYDPSDHGGTKAAVVSSNANGLFDESIAARCRPGLHDFLTEVYKEYDLMVWSASDMTRILKLLQQLGMCSAGPCDYRLLAVLDIDSMSEMSAGGAGAAKAEPAANDCALVQTVTVPVGAVPGQQIEAICDSDGSTMVVMVPPGLKPGDVFCVTAPGAMSGIGDEVDTTELQLALQMSMGGQACADAPIQRARRRGRHIKPLSLIWACREFSDLYSERNTVIVDDTVDVCRANPRNSIQCSRYFWKDHTTDVELPRLARYLSNIAQAPAFPPSHERWRDGV